MINITVELFFISLPVSAREFYMAADKTVEIKLIIHYLHSCNFETLWKQMNKERFAFVKV